MGMSCFLFDLDGTLIDSNGAILASLRRMEERLSLKPLSEETLRTFLGPALKDSIMTHYHVSSETAMTMIEVYRDSYMEVGIERTAIFDGVFEFLRYIRTRGGRAALATLKEYHLAEEILSRSGLGAYFDYAALDRGNEAGDKAALIRESLLHLGCRDPRRAVMFGDSPNDGYAAMEAGVAFVPLLCGEGFQQPGSLTGIQCEFSARTVEEMGKYIRSVI